MGVLKPRPVDGRRALSGAGVAYLLAAALATGEAAAAARTVTAASVEHDGAGGERRTVAMADAGEAGDAVAGDGVFSARVPASAVTGGYVFTLTLTALERSVDADVDVGATPTTLAINELMASNGDTVLDPQGDDDDWVELYNWGTDAIDLSGMYLSDRPSNPLKWRFPEGVTIAAGGYLLIWADDDAGDSPGLHTNFKLSAGGESVVLSDVDARDNVLIDSVSFPALGSDVAYGRTPEGTGAFAVLGAASPGRAMPVVPEVSIEADGPVTEGGAATFAVTAVPAPDADLAVGVTVTQGDGDDYLPAAPPTSVTVAAGSRTATLRVAIPNDDVAEANGVVTATLVDGDGYTVSAPSSASARVRDDDGGTAAPGVAINELMASNGGSATDPQGDDDDWIELFNNSGEDIDLSGMYLSDDRRRPKKWKFPAGTTIGARAYLLVWADDDEGDSPGLHTNFKLSAGGESVVLTDTDANGNAEVDAVDYPRLGRDETYARVPDGTGEFVVLAAGSPGAAAVPAWSVSASPPSIGEGESSTVTVAISNGVRFATDRTVVLEVRGTAGAADRTVSPTELTLVAGTGAVTATVSATLDLETEAAETVVVEARLGTETLGTATVTVAANSAPVSADGFDLVDAASTGTVLAALADDAVLDLSQHAGGVNIRANVGATWVTARVGFELSGARSLTWVSDGAAGAFLAFGPGASGDPWGGALADGAYTLTATRHIMRDGAEVALPPRSVRFTVTGNFDASSSPLTGLTAVTAGGADAVGLGPLSEGATVDLSAAGGRMNVRAVRGADPRRVGSVSFSLTGERSLSWMSDGAAGAFLAFGPDAAADPWRGALANGTYRLDATPYTGANGGGEASPALGVSFSVTGSYDADGSPVSGFALLEAAGSAVIGAIADGAEMDVTGRGMLEIRADLAADPRPVGGMEMTLQGPVSASRRAEAAPFLLDGDAGLRLRDGRYRLTATPFAAPAANALELPARSVSFSLTGTGAPLEDYDIDLAGTYPTGLWSDGEVVWVSDWTSRRVRAFGMDGQPRAGQDIRLASDTKPMGLWSDGTVLWVALYGVGVHAYGLADGARRPGRDLSLSADNEWPMGVWSDGETVWVSDYYGDALYAHRLADGVRTPARDIAMSDGNAERYGLWSDGETLWVALWMAGSVRAYRLSDGGRVPQLDIDASSRGNDEPMGLWSDGRRIWITDTANGKLYAHELPAGRPGASPVATVAAVSGAVAEGSPARFEVTLDPAPAADVAMAIAVSESGAAVSGTAPSSVTFAAGSSQATLAVATDDDAVVEDDSVVTAVLSAGPGYTLGADDTAAVTVSDDDTASFSVALDPVQVGEGGTSTVTVSISNGVTFAEDQTIALSVTGTVSAADYTLSPSTLELAAGSSSATSELTAVDDADHEGAETATVTARHAGVDVGAAALTIAASDVPSSDARLASLTLTDADIGTFSADTTSYAATVDHAVAATTVTAPPTSPGAAVEIADADGTSRGTERTVSLAVGGNAITVTVTAADGTTTRTYAVTVTRAAPALTAALEDVPERHLGTEFTFRVRFSEALANGVEDLRDHGFTVTGGQVREARQVQGAADGAHWEMRVQPAAGIRAVAIGLAADRACGTPGAVCTADGRRLTTALAATVAGGAPWWPTARQEGNTSPRGLWSDGDTVWVADNLTSRLFAYRLVDGERRADRDVVLESLARTAGSLGVWSDGETLWSANGYEAWLRGYRLSDGARDASRDISLEGPVDLVRAVWGRGGTLWTVERDADALKAYRPDGTRDAPQDVAGLGAAGNGAPWGLWGSGAAMWVSDYVDGKVYAYRDGARAASLDVSLVRYEHQRPTGLWSDGATLWVSDFANGRVWAYELPTGDASSPVPTVRSAMGSSAAAAADGPALAETNADPAAPPSAATGTAPVARPESARAAFPADGDIALAGGDVAWEGRVEVHRDGAWGGVCADHWSLEDAEVACRQAGHGPALQAVRGGHFGAAGSVALGSRGCLGPEARLVDCPAAGASGCGTAVPAGAVCTPADAAPGVPAPVAAQTDGASLTLFFDRALDAAFAPGAADFEVRSGEVEDATRHAVRRVEVVGRRLTLAVSPPVPAGTPVRTSYLRPARHPLRAAVGGLEAAAFDEFEATDAAGLGGEAPVPADGAPAGWVEPGLEAAVRAALRGRGDREALVRLDASRRGIADLAGVGALVALEELNLAGNAVEDLAPLAGLPRLRVLDLAGNRVAELWALASAAGLERLVLAGNRIDDAAGLRGLSNLRVLDLSGNALDDAWALGGLTGLEYLSVADNEIWDAGPLAGLPGLVRLDLGGNAVTDVAVLAGLDRLVWLRLSGNRVSRLDGLGRLVRLRWVLAGDNPLVGGAALALPAGVRADAGGER